MQPLRIFIGWDPRQPVAYTVLQHSIVARTSAPVSVVPLKIETLPFKRTGLTPFTFSRFLVPWICGYRGHALFLDVDILVLDDVAKLFALADGSAVMVSKNEKRFEWASVMLFDCAHPDNAKLTPEFCETADSLHKISWTESIGSLPGEWNHLVGYDEPKPASLVHFTQGVPAWPETKDCEYADEWRRDAQEAISARPWVELMGNSVHAAPVMERLKGAA